MRKINDWQNYSLETLINYVEKYKESEKVTHHEVTPLTNEQLEKHFAIKIIRFEFSEPIVNRFE